MFAPKIVPGGHHWLMPGYYNNPPRRQIVRDNWFNLLTALLCLASAILLWQLCPPVITHYFPYFEGVETTATGLKYAQPLRDEYLDTVKMASISFCFPASIMLGMNLWVLRDFYNANAALTGLSYALSTSTLLACLLKIFVGGLRPNFYAICQPSPLAASTTVPSYTTAAHICTNTHKFSLHDAQMSFPSGHASSAFAGFVFLTLWLTAHLKTLGRRPQDPKPLLPANPLLAAPEDHACQSSLRRLAEPAAGLVPHWKLLLTAAPLGAAVVLALSKIRDGWHHPVDIVCGACIGTGFALCAYRMVYWSVWDTRCNHVPRTRAWDESE